LIDTVMIKNLNAGFLYSSHCHPGFVEYYPDNNTYQESIGDIWNQTLVALYF